MARLFWSPNAGREKQQSAPLNASNNPLEQTAEFVQPADIVYPAPGGGLLRVPPPGGAPAAQMFGTLPGQLTYYSQASGQWVPTATQPANGQIATWDATAGAWVFINRPTLGAIEYFDTTNAPVGLWNFNGTLADTSGNGNDLALAAGNLAFCDISPGKQGLYVLEAARYATANSAPVLNLLGECTIMAIVQRDQATVDTYMCSKAGSGETEAANQLYALILRAQAANTDLIRMRAQWEHGAGTDDLYDSAGNVSLPPIHNIMFVGMRRSAGGIVRFFTNGLPFGPDSTALTMPTGGGDASSRLVIGAASPTGTSAGKYVMFGLKIVPTALTDDQVKQEYNRTLGPAFGILT